MFFVFFRIPLPRKTIGPRYAIASNGAILPIGLPTLQAKRGGKWKKSGQPIDRVAFALPADWKREEGDSRSCSLHGPEHESGAVPVVNITVLEGPDDSQKLYSQLLSEHQTQEKFTLIEGGVVTRERGLQAAQLIYTCIADGVKIAVREMVFTVGFRSIAYAQSQCPVEIVAGHVGAINAVFDSLKPSRRLEVPGTLRAGM